MKNVFFTSPEEYVTGLLLFLMSLLFFIVGIKILLNSRSKINIYFSMSAFLFTLSTFSGGIGRLNINRNLFLGIAMFCLIIGSLGIYIGSKAMLVGSNQWLTGESAILILITVYLAIITFADELVISSKNGYPLNTYFGDGIVVFLFVLSVYQFQKVKSILPEFDINLNLLNIGISLAAFGLVLNIIRVYIFHDTAFAILREIFPLLGVIIVISIFTPISQWLQEKYGNITKNEISWIVTNLDSSVCNLKSENEIIEKKLLPGATISVDRKVYSSNYSNIKSILLQNISTLALIILIELAASHPDPLTNKSLQIRLKKSKATLSFQLKNLLLLGYIIEDISLLDTRKKPYLITEKGKSFLFHLHQSVASFIGT